MAGQPRRRAREGRTPAPGASGMPARGETRTHPPFEPGNVMALRHGAYSPRKVDPLATELVEQLLAQAAAPGSSVAYVAEPSYRPSVWAWARVEARVQLLVEYLEERGGDVDDEGEVRAAAQLLTKLEGHAAKLRSQL